YCGTVGDGCGGSLVCGDDCPSGWTCGTDQICKAVPPACTLLACTTSSGDHYCGTVGNACGGSLECGNDCPTGWTCGTDHICKGGTGVCTAIGCDTASGDHYCGSIGDKCGGSLDCGTTCPKSGWTCDHNLCKGDATCVPLTCQASSADTYCGAIGDGCGGTLDCGSTCPKAGWVCTSGLCKAGPTAGCVPKTCTTANGDQYCGDIGDGCGNTLHCGSTCSKSGWTCQDSICKAGPTAGCTANLCTVATGQYCGDIGDGCGGTVHCGTTCSTTNWTCQNNQCKAGPAAGCVPVSCTPAGGGRYCGTIGDGCGNSKDCGSDCSAAGSGWQCDNTKKTCVGGPTCVKTTCNNSSGVQQYCGDIGDGCGGTVSCPATCSTSGVTCGAVSPHVCETCGNLCLKRVRCDGGAFTSLSGVVYDPAGANPLYNVIVSIPNAALTAITPGAPTCASCDAQVSGQPLATALTDANGHFVLNNIPWNSDFPLVMQLGKWRRQITISKSLVTQQCADNAIPNTWRANATSTPTNPSLRLPRKISDGDNNGLYTSMPKIAITTGAIDALECLLTRIGIDPTEFTNPSPGGAGHINLFSLLPTTDTNHGDNGAETYAASSGGATFPAANTLF
ncbi:MAG TPA: carboxypeptidase-like regulatory domain-containing protein, partial [Polyangia bacterium]